ncbi:protein-export chaperone SecB [Neptunomonas phycophila]|uniref:protein-export chaperone SecB n=1 Tax=Neptunomonas phycophila TaxID=1572645 RepID=UPI00094901E8|nr:protein-export chaperone SecB [Neptunomonas phycophila]
MSENEQAAQQPKGPQFAVQRLYLKDSSLETPNSPQVFTKQWKPEVNLEMNTATNQLSEEHFEVVLTLTVTAKNDGDTAFLVEVHQGGIFLVGGMSDQDKAHALGAFCPNVLFPYAREAVDNLVTKASFPPLMLAPVNFDALYAQKMQRAAAEQNQPTETH